MKRISYLIILAFTWYGCQGEEVEIEGDDTSLKVQDISIRVHKSRASVRPGVLPPSFIRPALPPPFVRPGVLSPHFVRRDAYQDQYYLRPEIFPLPSVRPGAYQQTVRPEVFAPPARPGVFPQPMGPGVLQQRIVPGFFRPHSAESEVVSPSFEMPGVDPSEGSGEELSESDEFPDSTTHEEPYQVGIQYYN